MATTLHFNLYLYLFIVVGICLYLNPKCFHLFFSSSYNLPEICTMYRYSNCSCQSSFSFCQSKQSIIAPFALAEAICALAIESPIRVTHHLIQDVLQEVGCTLSK